MWYGFSAQVKPKRYGKRFTRKQAGWFPNKKKTEYDSCNRNKSTKPFKISKIKSFLFYFDSKKQFNTHLNNQIHISFFEWVREKIESDAGLEHPAFIVV